jgi:hypothetical protein
MSREAVGDDPTTDGGRPADEPGAVTWADIYDSPEVDRVPAAASAAVPGGGAARLGRRAQ